MHALPLTSLSTECFRYDIIKHLCSAYSLKVYVFTAGTSTLVWFSVCGVCVRACVRVLSFFFSFLSIDVSEKFIAVSRTCPHFVGNIIESFQSYSTQAGRCVLNKH